MVVGNLLEYVWDIATEEGLLKIVETEEKYIFERLYGKDGIRFREIFTGLIVNKEESIYFNMPHIVNIKQYMNIINKK